MRTHQKITQNELRVQEVIDSLKQLEFNDSYLWKAFQIALESKTAIDSWNPREWSDLAFFVKSLIDILSDPDRKSIEEFYSWFNEPNKELDFLLIRYLDNQKLDQIEASKTIRIILVLKSLFRM